MKPVLRKFNLFLLTCFRIDDFLWDDRVCSEDNFALCKRACTQNVNDDDDDNDESFLDSDAGLFVIGGSIGGCIFLSLLIVLICFVIKRNKKRNAFKGKKNPHLNIKDEVEVEEEGRPVLPSILQEGSVGVNSYLQSEIYEDDEPKPQKRTSNHKKMLLPKLGGNF